MTKPPKPPQSEPKQSSQDQDQSEDTLSLWDKFKATVTPKKESKEHEGLALQKKIEIYIRDSNPQAPKDNRFDGVSSTVEPGFLEFKSKKKLSKSLEIDAKLDLHGLTQDQAYKRLEAFLDSCFRTGKQNTLIITGKGLQIDTRGSESERQRRKNTGQDYGKGVLRRQLPLWLESPHLRGYIHHYTNSHPFEGGTGAFYVRLRRDKSK